MSDPGETRIELRKRKRSSNEDEMDITPMIDIVFLLLAFFVVVSKMDPTDAVAFPTSRHGDSVPDRNTVSVFVISNGKEIPNVYLGGKKDELLCSGSIEDIEEQVSEYVAGEMLNNPLKTAVVIKADKDVQFRYIDIMKQAIGGHLHETHSLNVAIEDK